MMKRLAILFAVVPLLASCEGTGNQCERLSFIPVSPAPPGAVETAANQYDTPATVARVGLHNKAVSKVCGALPAPANGG